MIINDIPLPEGVDVKFQIQMCDTYAADGTLLEWMSLSEGSSSSGSESEPEIESIQISNSEDGISENENVRNLTKMFEKGKSRESLVRPNLVRPNRNNVKNLAGYFDKGPTSLSEADSGFGVSHQSATSFEGSILDHSDHSDTLGRRSSTSLRSRARSASATPRSKSRMERGAERAKAKLEALKNMKFPTSDRRPRSETRTFNNRSRSVDPLKSNKTRISSELRTIEKREETRRIENSKFDENSRSTINSSSGNDKIKVNVDKANKEISMTLSPQLELETIANLGTQQSRKKMTSQNREKTITVKNRKGKSGGQTIILEEKITKKTPKFGAQATNKPLKKINLTNATPYCFEVIHKQSGKQISNLHICQSDEFQNRVKLMVEINRMRYFALFYPTQKMEHIKTLVYVLTGVMPRLQEVYYRQLMESQLPFEQLISGTTDDVIKTKNTLQQHMNLGLLTRNERMVSRDDSMVGSESIGSINSWNHQRTQSFLSNESDEAYGSDKSGSGDEKVRGRNMSWDRNSSKGRSKSSDVRAGKFLNKLRGQKFSNLKPEMYHNKKSPLTESEFFTCYNYLLKSGSMSDEEHDARHDLLVYIQTKLDDYQWSTVKAFHDQVQKSWERGLIGLDDSLEKFKFHYFDGKISKMKAKNYKTHTTSSLRRYGYQRQIQI